jgi:hypothetical protein
MSVASFHRLTAAQPNLSHDPHRHHAHAFEAIAATLPLDSVGYEPFASMPLWRQSSGRPPVHALRVLLVFMAGGEIGQTIGSGYRHPEFTHWFREMDWAKVTTRAACVMGIPGGFCGITPPGTQTVLGPTVRRPPTHSQRKVHSSIIGPL